MQMANDRRCSVGVLCVALATLGVASRVHARPYPTNSCVGAKLAAAAMKCGGVLKAWSRWDNTQDVTRRDDALARAATRFTNDWQAAEQSATTAGVDCA